MLIVLSGDFGELGMARCFVTGQPFAERVRMVAPASLRPGFSPGERKVSFYSNELELMDVIRTVAADVVMLFSGYLLAANGPLSIGAIQRLVRSVQAESAVVTSDPLIGLAGKLRSSMLDFGRSGIHRSSVWDHVVAPARSHLTARHFRRVHDALRGIAHLYPGPMGVDVGGASRLSFFNRAMLSGGPSSDVRDLMAGAAPVWLFLLSEIDLRIQENLYGSEFYRCVHDRMADAQRQGRQPILIAPRRLLNAVSAVSDDSPRARMLTSLPYTEFVATLLGAESVFYWNVFSFSTLLRIVAGKAVFFFDRGHLSRLIRPYYDLAADCYLAGYRPTILNHEASLTSDSMEEQMRQLRHQTARIAAYHARAAEPSAVLDLLSVP